MEGIVSHGQEDNPRPAGARNVRDDREGCAGPAGYRFRHLLSGLAILQVPEADAEAGERLHVEEDQLVLACLVAHGHVTGDQPLVRRRRVRRSPGRVAGRSSGSPISQEPGQERKRTPSTTLCQDDRALTRPPAQHVSVPTGFAASKPSLFNRELTPPLNARSVLLTGRPGAISILSSCLKMAYTSYSRVDESDAAA